MPSLRLADERPVPAAHGHTPAATCAICGRCVQPSRAVCFCCQLTARQLGLPLVPMVALREYRVGDADHRRLRGYKDAPTAAGRDRFRREVVDGMAAWLRAHDGLLVDRFGPWSVVTTVPSSRRIGSAPAEVLVDDVPVLAGRHLRLLGRGRGPLDHLEASRDGFTPLPGVDRTSLAGHPVLVFDDSVTTGSRAQSAAAALRLIGVRVVGIVVVGRALAPLATGGC